MTQSLSLNMLNSHLSMLDQQVMMLHQKINPPSPPASSHGCHIPVVSLGGLIFVAVVGFILLISAITCYFRMVQKDLKANKLAKRRTAEAISSEDDEKKYPCPWMAKIAMLNMLVGSVGAGLSLSSVKRLIHGGTLQMIGLGLLSLGVIAGLIAHIVYRRTTPCSCPTPTF